MVEQIGDQRREDSTQVDGETNNYQQSAQNTYALELTEKHGYEEDEFSTTFPHRLPK